MDIITFNNSCFFGINSISQLPNEIENRHLKNGLIITDSGLIEAGIYQKIANLLSINKIQSSLFSDISNEPTINDVNNALETLKRCKADFILAVGGGSAIDTAKATAIIATNEMYKDVISLQGTKNNLNYPLPLFVVPTTAGSGAEISKSLILENEYAKKKIICFSDKILPIAVFIDPELMISMPDIVTLSSGFDALTHAIESLICNKANMFSDTLAKEAINLIVKNLPESYDNPENLEARQNMAYAEYIAGLAYSSSGLGLCHSMAHAVAGKYHIPHGVALSISLPATLKYNMYSKANIKYKFIAEAFGVNTSQMTLEEICRRTIKEVQKFRDDFNIPSKYSVYGVREEDLDSLALATFEDACTATNPRETTVSDIYLILKKLS